MNIELSTQSIVDALQTAITGIGARWLAAKLPERQNEYKIAVPAENIWVIYGGSVADPSTSTRTISQLRKVAFNIEIYSRTLYDVNGAMAIRDVVEQVLIGFAPTNCQRLYLIKDDLTITDDMIWAHVLRLECVTMLVQKDDNDPVIVPSFVQLDFTDAAP